VTFDTDDYKFTSQSDDNKILKISQHLAKLWATVQLCFFDLQWQLAIFAPSFTYF